MARWRKRVPRAIERANKNDPRGLSDGLRGRVGAKVAHIAEAFDVIVDVGQAHFDDIRQHLLGEGVCAPANWPEHEPTIPLPHLRRS